MTSLLCGVIRNVCEELTAPACKGSQSLAEKQAKTGALEVQPPLDSCSLQPVWLDELARSACSAAWLAKASPDAQRDIDVVLSAVRKDGVALEHAAEDLRADRSVVLAAVAQDGCALKFASEELRADREVALSAVASNGEALKFVATQLRADYQVVCVAVACTRKALLFSKFPRESSHECFLMGALLQAVQAKEAVIAVKNIEVAMTQVGDKYEQAMAAGALEDLRSNIVDVLVCH